MFLSFLGAQERNAKAEQVEPYDELEGYETTPRQVETSSRDSYYDINNL